MNIISFDTEGWLNKAVTLLQNGEVIVFPSDTVYGLLCDASNPEAVKKLIAFKNRPVGKPISVFVKDLEMAHNYVEFSSSQRTMLTQMLPGPFTVVLPSKHILSSLLESEKGTLGIRIPHFAFITQLVHAFGKPVTATSANQSGQSPFYQVEDLIKETSQKKIELIGGIFDKGKLPYNKPSTVVDLSQPEISILRAGDLSWLHEESLVSSSEEETKRIAQSVFQKVEKEAQKQGKGLAFLLQGELGAGKTVFTKAVAALFSVDNIISPTYTIYYEYTVAGENKMYNNLYHFDLYNIQEREELETLRIKNLIDKKNLLIFEWGEKINDYVEKLKQKMLIVHVDLEYKAETSRTIHIKF